MLQWRFAHRQLLTVIALQPVEPPGNTADDKEELQGDIRLKLNGVEDPAVEHAADNARPPRMHIVARGKPHGEGVSQAGGDFHRRHGAFLLVDIDKGRP